MLAVRHWDPHSRFMTAPMRRPVFRAAGNVGMSQASMQTRADSPQVQARRLHPCAARRRWRRLQVVLAATPSAAKPVQRTPSTRTPVRHQVLAVVLELPPPVATAWATTASTRRELQDGRRKHTIFPLKMCPLPCTPRLPPQRQALGRCSCGKGALRGCTDGMCLYSFRNHDDGCPSCSVHFTTLVNSSGKLPVE